MVCLIINGTKLPHSEAWWEAFERNPALTSISYNINQEKTNVIPGQQGCDTLGTGIILRIVW